MRSSMLGTDVAAEKSHTIRASESKDTAGAGLSSGQPAKSQASNLLASSTSTVTSIEKPISGSLTVGNKKKLVSLSSPLCASDPRLAAYSRRRKIEGSRADTTDSQAGVLPKVGTETSSAASSSKLTIAGPTSEPISASNPEGMRETPVDAQARSEAVVPARDLNTGSKTAVPCCEEAAASQSTPPSVLELNRRNRIINTQDSSMVGGAAPEVCAKSGIDTSASTSTQVSVDKGSTSGENLTTVSGIEAAALDTSTSSEIGHGIPTSSSAPTSVPEVMTGSGPSVSNPGVTAYSSCEGTRTNLKSLSTQAESGEGRSTLGRTCSKAVVVGKGPVSVSSSGASGPAINMTSAPKDGPAEPRSSLKKQPQQRVPKAVPVSMTDVVDALSGPLSARRTTQASVVEAPDSSKGVTQNESGPRVSENERDTHGSHEEEAFRTRLTEELITMIKAMGGCCKMSTIASKYRRIFRRQLFLGGRKLRNLLENDGGLAGISLDDDSTDGGVIRLESPSDSTFATSSIKLTRTIVNKEALKHVGNSSLEDGPSWGTADTSKTLSVNNSVRSDAKSRGSESQGEDGLERRDSKPLHSKPRQSSTKATGASGRASTTSKTSLAVASRREHPKHPSSTTTIREHDRVKLDKKEKDEGKMKRGRSPGRSRSHDSRYLEGHSSTKRDRTRDAAPKKLSDLVDGRVFEGKYAHAGHRRDEREERILRTRSTRSRSTSVNLRKARSDSRSPNSYASSGRSVDSQSLARSRHGRKRSDAGVSSDRRYGHDRGQSGMDRKLSMTALRVKHEEHALGNETMFRKGDHRQEDYDMKNSTRAPTRGSNFRGDIRREHMPYVGAQRDFHLDKMIVETRDSYLGARKGKEVFDDRRGVRVESTATSSKRRLTDGVNDVFHEAHANGNRPTKRYATTALGRGIGRQPSNEGAASRAEWAVHSDDGMRADVPMRALLPSPGTIQPVSLSGDRPQGARLIIKGTHPAVPERKIHALASAYGTVGKIEVLEEFVFVHMKYLEEAERAVVGLSGRLLPNVSAGRNVPLMAAVWREEMYQALMSRDNMRTYADSMRKASTWYEKHKNLMFEGTAEGSIPCRFFALGRGCVFGNNCEFVHENNFEAGATRDAPCRGAIANGAPPSDPLAISSSMPPGRHEMVSGEHPVVRHRVPVNESRKEHSRDVFVQNDEQHSRPPTSIRGRQQPEPLDGMDVVPSGGVPSSWRSEHRGPEQTNLPRARTGSIGHAFDGMRAKTWIDPYRGECSGGYTTNRIGDRPEQEYRNVKQGGAIPGGGTKNLAKRHYNRSPRRGPYESRERVSSRKGTTRDGASRHGISLDAIDDVHFGLRRSEERERTDSRSTSMERPRSRGSISRRNSHDVIHPHYETDRRDLGVSRHKHDNDIVAPYRHDRDFYRRDHDTSRRGRDVSRRDHEFTRRGRRDGRREREDSHNSSRSGSGGGYPRDSRGRKRDGTGRGRDYHDKKRRPVRGGKRHAPVRDESESSKERFDDRSESRIGDRGQRRGHSRSLSNRGRRRPSRDEGMRARSSENRVERDDQRGSRREGREQEVIFSGLRAGGGYEDYESGWPSRQDHRAAAVGNNEILDNKKIGQEFPDFDDELMGESKAVDDDGQVETTFTVTACLDPQQPEVEAASAPSTTFSVTMPSDPTDVLKHRSSRDKSQGGKHGRGRGARGGRGTRGRGGRGGRGSYQQHDGAYQDV